LHNLFVKNKSYKLQEDLSEIHFFAVNEKTQYQNVTVLCYNTINKKKRNRLQEKTYPMATIF